MYVRSSFERWRNLQDTLISSCTVSSTLFSRLSRKFNMAKTSKPTYSLSQSNGRGKRTRNTEVSAHVQEERATDEDEDRNVSYIRFNDVTSNKSIEALADG